MPASTVLVCHLLYARAREIIWAVAVRIRAVAVRLSDHRQLSDVRTLAQATIPGLACLRVDVVVAVEDVVGVVLPFDLDQAGEVRAVGCADGVADVIGR
jgi:hypothetical protein